jgi:hypothetical protein
LNVSQFACLAGHDRSIDPHLSSGHELRQKAAP